MKNTLRIDPERGRIIMDRTFAKASAIVGSEEYDKLQMARRDYPNYHVIKKQIKRNSGKECYRGLTYDYMREYIASHPNAMKTMEEFNELLLKSKCHSIRYPTVKKWFLITYPEVKNYSSIGKDTEETETKKAA